MSPVNWAFLPVCEHETGMQHINVDMGGLFIPTIAYHTTILPSLFLYLPFTSITSPFSFLFSFYSLLLFLRVPLAHLTSGGGGGGGGGVSKALENVRSAGVFMRHIPDQDHQPPTVGKRYGLCGCGNWCFQRNPIDWGSVCVCVCLSLSLVKAKVKVMVEGRVEAKLGRDVLIPCTYSTDDGIGGLTIEWFYVS